MGKALPWGQSRRPETLIWREVKQAGGRGAPSLLGPLPLKRVSTWNRVKWAENSNLFPRPRISSRAACDKRVGLFKRFYNQILSTNCPPPTGVSHSARIQSVLNNS